MVTVTLMQNDTDTRDFTLSDAVGAINLSKYFPNISFCMDNEAGNYYEIPCSQQSSTSATYSSLFNGGISVQFTSTHLAVSGNYIGQFVLTDSTGNITYPLGDPITVTVLKGIRR